MLFRSPAEPPLVRPVPAGVSGRPQACASRQSAPGSVSFSRLLQVAADGGCRRCLPEHQSGCPDSAEGAGCTEGDPTWRIASTPVAAQGVASWRQSAQQQLARKRKVAVDSQKQHRSKRSPLARRGGTSGEQYDPSVAALGFPGFLGEPCTPVWMYPSVPPPI